MPPLARIPFLDIEVRKFSNYSGKPARTVKAGAKVPSLWFCHILSHMSCCRVQGGMVLNFVERTKHHSREQSLCKYKPARLSGSRHR